MAWLEKKESVTDNTKQMKAMLIGLALSIAQFTPEVIEYQFTADQIRVDVDVYSPTGEYLHTLKVRATKDGVEFFNVLE